MDFAINDSNYESFLVKINIPHSLYDSSYLELRSKKYKTYQS